MVDIALMEQAAADKTPVTQVDLATIVAKAKRLVEIEMELDDLAAQATKLSKERESLRIHELPEMMFANDMTSVGVGNKVIVIEPIVEASVPKEPERLERVVNYLVDIGEGGNIKRALQLDLPKGDAAMEDKICTAIRTIAVGLNPRITPSIHAQTYKAIMRRLVKSGRDLPRDLLGVFIGHIARVEDK